MNPGQSLGIAISEAPHTMHKSRMDEMGKLGINQGKVFTLKK
jgi:hypothetical protein